MLVTPPPPLIKVASNSSRCSKLGGTTLNGREEGDQYCILQTCDQKEERSFFRRTISLFLQLVVVISRNGAGEGITNLNPCLWHFGAWAIYLAWENSQGHHCFPRGMTSEQRLQKFRTDDVNSPHLGQGGSSDWPCGERNLLQPIRSTIPHLGNGTSSVWNFSARSSGVISRGITQCRLCFQASTLTIQWNSCKPKRKWKN